MAASQRCGDDRKFSQYSDLRRCRTNRLCCCLGSGRQRRGGQNWHCGPQSFFSGEDKVLDRQREGDGAFSGHLWCPKSQGIDAGVWCGSHNTAWSTEQLPHAGDGHRCWPWCSGHFRGIPPQAGSLREGGYGGAGGHECGGVRWVFAPKGRGCRDHLAGRHGICAGAVQCHPGTGHPAGQGG